MRRRPPLGYEKKFADFIRMCREAKEEGATGVFIATPHALGDNYLEIIESLSRLQDAELSLMIAPLPADM